STTWSPSLRGRRASTQTLTPSWFFWPSCFRCYTLKESASERQTRKTRMARRVGTHAMRDLLRRQWHELRLNLIPREFLYWLVQNLLLMVIKLRMQVQVFGGDQYASPAPATLLISSHKRDWDPLICATHIYYQRGWWRPDGRRMAFVGREDMLS